MSRSPKNEVGATLLEQAFVIFFLAVVSIAAIKSFSFELKESFESTTDEIVVADGGESLTSTSRQPIGGVLCGPPLRQMPDKRGIHFHNVGY